jgi:hypothetical protein
LLMNSTAPLWVTLLLAVLAPVVTLVGVLWTQRAADRRATNELRLRHENDLALHKFNHRRDVYEKFAISLEFIGFAAILPTDFDKISRNAESFLAHNPTLGLFASPKVDEVRFEVARCAFDWQNLPDDASVADRLEKGTRFMTQAERLIEAMKLEMI